MKKVVKVSLLLMAILTVIYAGAVVYAYANANPSYHDVVYGAYKIETTPTDWYTPEQLGIVEIIEYEYGDENSYLVHVVVDREKEPFPLQEEQPIFKYKDKFYQISALWVTPGLPESVKGQLIIGGGILAAGWALAGALIIIRERRK